MIVKCMHSYLSQDWSYILCNSVIIFTSFHLDIHYSLGFINSFLDRAIVLSDDSLCKQFGSWSVLTKRRF